MGKQLTMWFINRHSEDEEIFINRFPPEADFTIFGKTEEEMQDLFKTNQQMRRV